LARESHDTLDMIYRTKLQHESQKQSIYSVREQTRNTMYRNVQAKNVKIARDNIDKHIYRDV